MIRKMQSCGVLSVVIFLSAHSAFSNCDDVESKNENIARLIRQMESASSGTGFYSSKTEVERRTAISDAVSTLPSQFESISAETKKCETEIKKSEKIGNKPYIDQFKDTVVGVFAVNYDRLLSVKKSLKTSALFAESKERDALEKSLSEVTSAMDGAKESVNGAKDRVLKAVESLPPAPLLSKDAIENPVLRSTAANYKVACEDGGTTGDFTVDQKCFMKAIRVAELADHLAAALLSNEDHVAKKAAAYEKALDRFCDFTDVSSEESKVPDSFDVTYIKGLSSLDEKKQAGDLRKQFESQFEAERSAYSALDVIRTKLNEVLASEDRLIDASNRSQVSIEDLKRQYASTVKRIERAQSKSGSNASTALKETPFPLTPESQDQFLKKLRGCALARKSGLDPTALVTKKRNVSEVDERHTGNRSVGRKIDRIPAGSSAAGSTDDEDAGAASSIGADTRPRDSKDHNP